LPSNALWANLNIGFFNPGKTMIWIDYVIIGLVSSGLIIGLLRGFSLEFFSVIFWLLAIGIGLSFSREFSVFLESTISNS
jgi:membrane protein required for colicin V production